MSQIYKTLTSGGPIPPTIPTSFVTDDGTAIPAANVLNVDGLDSTENNSNGIFTRADPNLSNNLEVILSNRTRVIATTSDGAGQTQTVTIFTPTVSTGITFVVSITGYDSANNEVTGGELVGIARRSGGGVTVVIGTNDTFSESDAGLVTTDWDIVTDGTLIQVQFVGVAGRSIAWSAVFIYDQTP